MKCLHKLRNTLLIGLSTMMILSLGTGITSLSNKAHAQDGDEVEKLMDESEDKDYKEATKEDVDSAIHHDKKDIRNAYYDYVNEKGVPGDEVLRKYVEYGVLIGIYPKRIAKKIHFHPTKRMFIQAKKQERKKQHYAWVHRPYYEHYGNPLKSSTSSLAKFHNKVNRELYKNNSKPWTNKDNKRLNHIIEYGQIKRNQRWNYTLGYLQFPGQGDRGFDASELGGIKGLNRLSHNIFNRSYDNGLLKYLADIDDTINNNHNEVIQTGKQFINLLKEYHKGNNAFKNGFYISDVKWFYAPNATSYVRKHKHYINNLKRDPQFSKGYKAGKEFAHPEPINQNGVIPEAPKEAREAMGDIK